MGQEQEAAAAAGVGCRQVYIYVGQIQCQLCRHKANSDTHNAFCTIRVYAWSTFRIFSVLVIKLNAAFEGIIADSPALH